MVIFDQKFDFWPNFWFQEFLTKLLIFQIFELNFDFQNDLWRKFWFLTKFRFSIKKIHFNRFFLVFSEDNGAFDAINPLALNLQQWNHHFSEELGKHKNQIFTDFIDETDEWENIYLWKFLPPRTQKLCDFYWFLTKIFIFDEKFDLWSKSLFSIKNPIFDQNIWIKIFLDQNFDFLVNISISDQNRYLWPTSLFLIQISIFGENVDVW